MAELLVEVRSVLDMYILLLKAEDLDPNTFSKNLQKMQLGSTIDLKLMKDTNTLNFDMIDPSIGIIVKAKFETMKHHQTILTHPHISMGNK
ncbi:MAG: hypothetical protein REV35_01220 [Burkholderia sp.]|nr:hypothetical protein [Burkholderia sp.]